MNEDQAREDIRIIKAMLDKTRRAATESGTLFIVWGVLITLALLGTWVLGLLKAYRWEWAVWVGVTVIGWVYSAFYGYRQDRKAAVTTYTQIAARHPHKILLVLVAIGDPRTVGAHPGGAVGNHFLHPPFVAAGLEIIQVPPICWYE